MAWWHKKPRPYIEPRYLIFQKVQSVQSPLAIVYGYEEENPPNHLWHCRQTDKLYRRDGEDFIYVPTKKLSEMIREQKSVTVPG